MIKDSVYKTWGYTSKACELAFKPSSFFWSGALSSVSLLGSYVNLLGKIDFISSNPRYFGDSGSLTIGGVLFDIGYWAIAGIPYLFGKLLDISIGFSWDDNGIFSGIAKAITAIPAGVLGVALVALAGIPMYLAIPAILGVIELAARVSIAAVATISTFVSLSLSVLALGLATIATAGLTVCGIVSTLISPFAWLGSKMKECCAPQPEEVILASDSEPNDSVKHYGALQNNLPNFSIPNSTAAQVQAQTGEKIKADERIDEIPQQQKPQNNIISTPDANYVPSGFSGRV